MVDDLIAKGKYGVASRFLKTRLDLKGVYGKNYDATPFLVYLGELEVKIGHLSEAQDALKAAEVSAHTSDYWKPALSRQQAALYFARGEYAAAVTAAAKAYRSSRDWHYWNIRSAYCESIEAMAQLRIGNITEAEQLVLDALKIVPKGSGKSLFFAPRILYSACLVESHRGNHSMAEAYCQRGIEMTAKSRVVTRDLSLGYLALAECYFLKGDFVRSRRSGLRVLELTNKLFGSKHQDVVEALQVLALLDVKESKTGEARMHAQNALQIAKQVFGEGSEGVVRPTRTLNGVLKTSQ